MEEKKCAWLKKPDRAACAALLEEIAETPQAKSTAAFLISLSDFKSFNDIFGRHYGDLLLEKIIDYLGGFASSRVERCDLRAVQRYLAYWKYGFRQRNVVGRAASAAARGKGRSSSR